MRLLMAAGAPGTEDFVAALIGAPTLNIVGVTHPDAEICKQLSDSGRIASAPDLATLQAHTEADGLVFAADDVGGAAEAEGPGTASAVFLSSVSGTAGLSAYWARHGESACVLAPALHRSPHGLLRASLDTRRIGSPRFLRWTRWAPAGADELASGLIDDLAAVLDLMGRPAVTAYAAGQALGADGPDYVTTIVTFERGLTAVLDVGAAPAGGRPFDRAMLIGAHGSIHADGRSSSALRLDDAVSTPLDLDGGPFAGHVRAVEAFTRGDSLDCGLATQAAAVQDAVLASLASGRAEAVMAPMG